VCVCVRERERERERKRERECERVWTRVNVCHCVRSCVICVCLCVGRCCCVYVCIVFTLIQVHSLSLMCTLCAHTHTCAHTYTHKHAHSRNTYIPGAARIFAKNSGGGRWHGTCSGLNRWYFIGIIWWSTFNTKKGKIYHIGYMYKENAKTYLQSLEMKFIIYIMRTSMKNVDSIMCI